MQTVKIVVTGPPGAGRTSFIRSVSEVPLTSAEVEANVPVHLASDETLAAMDFGRITVDEDLVLYLFGAPGPRRSDFVRDTLHRGMLGFVLLVDSTRPDTFRSVRHMLYEFNNYASTPFIVVANKQDLPDAWCPKDIGLALQLETQAKVIPCVATDREQVKDVILELLRTILDVSDRPAAESRPAW